MKFVVILAIAVASVMAAPPTTGSGQSVADGTDGIVKRSLTSGSRDQNSANAVVRKRRVGVIDTNGQVRDLDDDDLRFVTTGLTGRQVAFKSKQNPIPMPLRIPVRSSLRGSVPSVGQATGDIVFVNSDESQEIDDFDDLDDLDDLAIISAGGQTFPFVNRQNAARFAPQSSFFNSLTSPFLVAARQTRMKSGLVQSKRASSTCTCPTQRETVNIFPQFSSRASRLMQLVRFPSQRFALPSFPGVKFVLDD